MRIRFLLMLFWPFLIGLLLVWLFPFLGAGSFGLGFIIYFAYRFLKWWNGR